MLSTNSYNLQNALCWGLCYQHYKEAYHQGCTLAGAVHLTCALLETLPILSQIVSLIELISCRYLVPYIIPQSSADANRISQQQGTQPHPVSSTALPNAGRNSQHERSDSRPINPSTLPVTDAEGNLRQEGVKPRPINTMAVPDANRNSRLKGMEPRPINPSTLPDANRNSRQEGTEPLSLNPSTLPATDVEGNLQQEGTKAASVNPSPNPEPSVNEEYFDEMDKFYEHFEGESSHADIQPSRADEVTPVGPTQQPQVLSPLPALSNHASVEELRGYAKYEALKRETQTARPEDRPWITPERRVCGSDGLDTIAYVKKRQAGIFIPDKEILYRHKMRFLPNPLAFDINKRSLETFQELSPDEPVWEKVFEGLEKELQAIGITENCKHVILQLATRSCVPTCVAMLVMDHGKNPDYLSIKYTNLAHDEQAIQWIEKAGLKHKLTPLADSQNVIETLRECIQKHGSGILSVNGEIGSHVVILDEIYEETAVIRDPYHGWAVTISLESLRKRISKNGNFIQITNTLSA